MRRPSIVLVSLLCLAGCGSSPSSPDGATGKDAAMTDAAPGDAAMGDAAPGDAASVDSAMPDAVMVDAAMADAAMVDAAMPDAAMPDAAMPDAAGADSATGDAAVGACTTGWANCDDDDANGCETDLHSDPMNCGACGTRCSFPNAQAACASGACQIARCDDGWADCDGSPSNGCEVRVSGDVDNCGACGKVCSGDQVARICTNGVCSGACASGWADCNGDKQTDGCETDIFNDEGNCGSCGHRCPIRQECGGGHCS